MIDTRIIKKPVPLDRQAHRGRRLRRGPDDLVACATDVNAVFVAIAEFVDVCREFTIVFIPAGKTAEGKTEFAPMAVLGLKPGENLMIKNGRWDARYIPVMLRSYPFALGHLDADRLALCVDDSYPGWSETDGEPLIGDDGQPTPFTTEMQQFLERFEVEAERSRAFCRRVDELGLLQTMRFDATLPDGQTLTVDGFYALDEKKFAELPDATVVELHRNGILGLLQAHHVSMGHMRHLVERRHALTANA